jgi:hypothetical protein
MKYQDVLKRFVSQQAQLLQEKQMEQQLKEQMLAAKAQALGSFIPGQMQSPQEQYSEAEYNPFVEGQEYKAGGIHIDPSKKGTFKAQATRMGMSIQEAASHILNNKEKYSSAMVKKANFAKNFAKEEGGIYTGDYMYEDGGEKDKKKKVTVTSNLRKTTELDDVTQKQMLTGATGSLDFKTKFGLTAGLNADVNNDRKDKFHITNQKLEFDKNIGETSFGAKFENQSDDEGNFRNMNSDVSAYLKRKKLGLDAINHLEKNEEGKYGFNPTVGLTYGSADEEGKNLRLQGEFIKDENGKLKVIPTIDAGYKSGPLSFTSQQRYEKNDAGRYNSDLNANLEYDDGMFAGGLGARFSKENYLDNPSSSFGANANLGYESERFGLKADANYNQNNTTDIQYDEEGNPINNAIRTSKFSGNARANANIPLTDSLTLKAMMANRFNEGSNWNPSGSIGLNYRKEGTPFSVGISNNFDKASFDNPNFETMFRPQVSLKYGFEDGGEMIRRADGSYSQRGLWDNIRANAGSGKKPTKEMLEQERKINNKYPDGGPIRSIVENTSGPRADEMGNPMDYLSFINSDQYQPDENEKLFNPVTGLGDKVYRQEGNPMSIDYIKSKLADNTTRKDSFNNLDPVHRYYDTELVNSARESYDTYKQSHLKDKVEGNMQNYADMEDVIKKAYEYNLKNGYDDTDVITSYLNEQAQKEGLDKYDFMKKYYDGNSPNAVARQLLVEYSKKLKK